MQSFSDDYNLQRGLDLLEKFVTVSDMYHFWRTVGRLAFLYPKIERSYPWWQDLDY
jgi:hypothetical protein